MSKFEDIKKSTVDDLQAIIGILAELKNEVANGDLGAVDRFFDSNSDDEECTSRFDSIWSIFLLRHTVRLESLGDK